MSEHELLVKAIQSLRPGAEFTVHGDLADGQVIFHDGTKAPTVDELKTEMVRISNLPLEKDDVIKLKERITALEAKIS